jgi:hypothetical protein
MPGGYLSQVSLTRPATAASTAGAARALRAAPVMTLRPTAAADRIAVALRRAR